MKIIQDINWYEVKVKKKKYDLFYLNGMLISIEFAINFVFESSVPNVKRLE
jgi:hypothetical protein